MVLFNCERVTDLQDRAVTPLTILLRLGSCPTYLSHKRAIRLQSWLGFNAIIGSTGTLNIRWEVQYTVLHDRSAYASRYKLCVTGEMVFLLGWCPPGVLVGIVHLRVPEPHTAGQSQSIGGAGLRFEGWLRIRGDQHALSHAVLVPS